MGKLVVGVLLVLMVAAIKLVCLSKQPVGAIAGTLHGDVAGLLGYAVHGDHAGLLGLVFCHAKENLTFKIILILKLSSLIQCW